MSELTERARIFALKAHEGQTRLNRAKTPLAEHIEEVAALVAASGGSDTEIAAAWLHDVVEDTPVMLTDITQNFGEEIAAIVFGLTDPPGFKHLHTLERKTAQADRICSLSDSVKRIKIADQISNVRSIAVDPPVHWDEQKRLDYAEGAKKIVIECCEVSELLFSKFNEAYWSALAAHLRESAP